MLLDLETLSEWDFQGKATKGELAGRQLARVELLLDYWFDWVRYNPKTEVVRPWQPKRKPTKPPIPKPDRPVIVNLQSSIYESSSSTFQ